MYSPGWDYVFLHFLPFDSGDVRDAWWKYSTPSYTFNYYEAAFSISKYAYQKTGGSSVQIVAEFRSMYLISFFAYLLLTAGLVVEQVAICRDNVNLTKAISFTLPWVSFAYGLLGTHFFIASFSSGYSPISLFLILFISIAIAVLQIVVRIKLKNE